MDAFLKNFDLVSFDLPMIMFGAVLFFVFTKAFSRLVVAPFASIVKARELATTGADAQAKIDKDSAGEFIRQYEEALTQVRIEAMKDKLSVVSKAKEDAAKITSDAEGSAQDFLKRSRAEARSEEMALRGRIAEQSASLSQSLVEKVRSSLTIYVLLTLSATVLLSAGNAWAGGGHHVTTPPPPFGEFLLHLGVYWGNLLIYVTILFLIVRKPLAKTMAARRFSVEESVRSSRSAAESARHELDQAKSKLAQIPSETARIRKEIQNEGLQEAALILEEAKKRAARTEQQARDLASAERKSVEKQVENELVAQALAIAREKLKAEMNTEKDRQFRRAAINRVEGLVH